MKKILLVLNHSLAGFGSDEQAQLKPSGKKAPLGPGVTLLPFLQKQGAEIVATLYCGDQYYLENEEEVAKKFIGFAKSFMPMRFFADQPCIILILEKWLLV